MCLFSVYKYTIIQLYVSVQYVQLNYFTALCFCEVCTGALYYWCMCQRFIYRGIIILLNVSVQYV